MHSDDDDGNADTAADVAFAHAHPSISRLFGGGGGGGDDDDGEDDGGGLPQPAVLVRLRTLEEENALLRAEMTELVSAFQYNLSVLEGRDVEIERMEEVAQTLRSSLAAQSETLNEVRSQSSYLSSRLQDSLTTNSMAQKDFKTKAEQLNEKLQNTRKKMARDNEVRDAQIQKLKKDLEIQQAQFNDREKEFAAEMKKVRKEHQAELQRKADLLAAQKAELSAADIREKALEEAAASSREKAKRDSVERKTLLDEVRAQVTERDARITELTKEKEDASNESLTKLEAFTTKISELEKALSTAQAEVRLAREEEAKHENQRKEEEERARQLSEAEAKAKKEIEALWAELVRADAVATESCENLSRERTQWKNDLEAVTEEAYNDKERVRDLEECLLERDAHVQTLKTQVELLEKRLGKSGNTTSSASAAIDGDKSKLKKRDYKKQVLELTSIDNRLHSLEDSIEHFRGSVLSEVKATLGPDASLQQRPGGDVDGNDAATGPTRHNKACTTFDRAVGLFSDHNQKVGYALHDLRGEIGRVNSTLKSKNQESGRERGVPGATQSLDDSKSSADPDVSAVLKTARERIASAKRQLQSISSLR